MNLLDLRRHCFFVAADGIKDQLITFPDTADGFLTLYTPDGSGELQPDLFVGDSCGLFRLIIGKIRSVSSKVLPAFSSGYDRSSSSVTRFSIKDRKS